jgi:hypothetical protein
VFLFFFSGLALRRWHLRTMLMMIDVESEWNDRAVVPLPSGIQAYWLVKPRRIWSRVVAT